MAAATDRMTEPTALVMCRADPNGCPRPRRMALTLADDGYGVSTLATAAMADRRIHSILLPDLPIHRLTKTGRLVRLAARRYRSLLWSRELSALGEELRQRRFDLVICHDLDLLPLASAAAGAGRLVFDAREYYPRHFEDRLSWRLLYGPMNTRLCRDYLHRCDLVLTVSNGLAAEYRRVFGVTPRVVRSLPPWHDLTPSPVAPDQIRLVHHGWANRSRRLEDMIRIMDHVDGRYSLDLMLLPLEAGYDGLLRREAQRRRNVRIVAPVPYEQLIPATREYDVGVFLCPPTTFNLRHALPNKLFEFIQARLAVAIGPSPEMRAVVEQWGCGTVAADFDPRSLANNLNALSAESIRTMKGRAHEAAANLHSQATGRQLLAEFAGLLSSEASAVAGGRRPVASD
jgi:glycosyltransferase involved in cell wall biosynthesis